MAADEDAIAVPYDSLQAETLLSVIEEFITRAGTDYGAIERTHEEKVADVMRQLKRGEARLMFDLKTNTVNIVPARGR